MRTLLAVSLAIALLAVGCKEKGPSARERTLDGQVKRLEADLAAEGIRAATLEDNLKKAEDEKADLTGWVTKRGEDYIKSEAAKDQEAGQLKATIKDLRVQIEKLKMPAPLPEGPTLEQLQRRMATAREKLEALGAVLLDAARPVPARDALLVARQLGSTRPAVYYMLGRASADIKMDEAAEENFRLAVAALEKQTEQDVPLTVRCLLARGAALRRLGEPDKAVAEWQKALKLDAKNAAAHYNLGLVYAADPAQHDAAVAALRKHITCGGRRTASARKMIEGLLEPATTP
jgi:tetratricopeptide (TPR) repeat protein